MPDNRRLILESSVIALFVVGAGETDPGKFVEDGEHEVEIWRRLTHLPARLGGFRLLSHRACALHAYAAATKSADELIEALYDIPGLDVKESGKSRK